MSAKPKAKKSAPKKKTVGGLISAVVAKVLKTSPKPKKASAPPAKSAKPAAKAAAKPAKAAVKAAAPKATAKPTKAAAKPAAKAAKPEKAVAAKPEKKAAAPVVEKDPKKKTKRNIATEALEAALAESDAPTGEEEEFDPAAFFGGAENMGEFRPHVMRKERVDLALSVRYRYIKGPLVFNAELINLSKGGLCLRTPEKIKNGVELRIEIPLPHTSELFAVMAEVVWSDPVEDTNSGTKHTHTGLRFKPMSLAKQTVINQFIQQRRDEVIMAKIGLDKFTDSVPVAGLD